MEETRPYAYDETRAGQVAPLIQDLVQCALDAVREG
jgi:N-formylglutamate deformylase